MNIDTKNIAKLPKYYDTMAYQFAEKTLLPKICMDNKSCANTKYSISCP